MACQVLEMGYLKNLKRLKIVLLHIVAWTVYLSIGFLKNFFDGMEHLNPLDTLNTELPLIYAFYLNYIILRKFLTTRRYVLLFVSEVLLFFSCAFLYYITGYIIDPLINPNVELPAFVLSRHLISTFWVFMIYVFFSCGYYFALESVGKEKRLRNMEREQLIVEQDKLQAEYAFLRAQINPHFLHNTLNFFYAKSLSYSRELSDGILTLCEIMRYSQNSGEDNAGTVLLVREVEHVKNVIKINQLRFSDRLQVDLTVSGDIEAVRIIPLVLITLVENAFKHGELTNSEHPVTLKLVVDDTRKHILFTTHNMKKRGPKELSHGIGMDNIRQRLHATYKNNFMLKITDEPDSYTTELSIHLGAAGGAGTPQPSSAYHVNFM